MLIRYYSAKLQHKRRKLKVENCESVLSALNWEANSGLRRYAKKNKNLRWPSEGFLEANSAYISSTVSWEITVEIFRLFPGAVLECICDEICGRITGILKLNHEKYVERLKINTRIL